jgi:DNA-binding response OmpR family regulator
MANLLLVDDDADFLKLQGELLRLAGYSVVTASNGKEAIRMAKDHAFDLVITDLVMPEKEGIETIMELRRKFPALKIIAMSGGGQGGAEDYLLMARHLGASQTLAKPFTGQELREAVSTVLERTA